MSAWTIAGGIVLAILILWGIGLAIAFVAVGAQRPELAPTPAGATG